MKRQRILLGILGGLALIVAWVYLVPDSPAPETARRAQTSFDSDAPDGRSRPALPAVSGGAGGDQDVRVVLPLRLADLDRPARPFVTGRDPWRFYQPPPKPPVVHKPTEAELRALREAEEARQRLLAQQRADQAALDAIPKPPPFTWTYLGSFGPAQHRIAVFSDGQRVINAVQGDTLENKFIVARIGYESVDIRFIGFDSVPALRLAVKQK